MRLSDWLGPDDELVPFGPRALAHAATQNQPREPPIRTLARSRQVPQASGTATHRCTRRCQARGSSTSPTSATADRRRYPRRLRSGVRRGRDFSPPAGARTYANGSSSWSTGSHGGGPQPGWRWWRGRSSSRSWRRWAARRATARRPRKPASAASPGSRSARRSPTPEPPHARRDSDCDDFLRSTPPSARSVWQRAGARSLQARHRPHAVVAPASVPSSATTGSVETPTTATAPAPAETTSAPSETEPVQTTSDPTPTTGGGGSAAGGGPSSGSQQQSAFGAGGSLGPGSSPNG